MDKVILADSLKLVAVAAGEAPPPDAVFLSSAHGSSVYIEGEPAALLRLAIRINEKHKCA